MKASRQIKISDTIGACLATINDAKLTREELIITLGQLLIRSGYSIHWGYEDTDLERPEKVDKEVTETLYLENPTTGTTLMKIGFDLQEVLLLKTDGKE